MKENSLQALRMKDVARKTTISESEIRRMIKKGKFPRGSFYCGTKIRIWTDQEVTEWMLDNLEAA